MLPTSRRFASRSARRAAALGATPALVLLLSSCNDALIRPPTGRLAPAAAAASLLDSPNGGNADFSVDGEAPLNGNEKVIGYFPTPTVMQMTVHQDIGITVLPPRPPSTGRLGLAGRVSGFGCSHQGEAYLVNYNDEGYGFPFAGCQLAGTPELTTFTDNVIVYGEVRYGYAFDAACPYPDAACASYSGSSGVSLSRLTASLAIGGDSVKGGVLRAFPRREYTLVALPNPDHLGRYATPVQPTGTGWTFETDSGVVESDICENGSGRICTKVFTHSGYLTLVAIVNGQEMTSSRLRVQMPELKLAVSSNSVAVGDTVLATTSVAGLDPTALSYYYLSVDGTGGQVPQGSPGSGPNGAGVLPCIGTRPLPTHCYVVLTQAGRMRLEVGAFLDTRGLAVFDYKNIEVRSDDRRIKLSVAQSTIRPTSRYWKFDPGTKIYSPHPTAPPDTSRTVVTVSVVDGTGKPVPNVDVTLGLTAHDLTAGHDHAGGKPTGIFQTLQKGNVPGGKINTGASGVVKLNFVASEISGPVTITGTSTGVVKDTVGVRVKVSGLVALAPGAHYVFDGAIKGRHTDNHYGTPAALAAFQTFAEIVSGWTKEPIGINDISLVDGGLFDVGEEQNWTPWDIPHGWHRIGTHADIRTKYASGKAYPKGMRLKMQDLWHSTLNFGKPAPEGDHLHLNFKAP
jgi:hypothetical protein